MTQAIRPMPEEMPRELWRGYQPASPVWQGSVKDIFITPQSGHAMISVSTVRAFADRGLEGDRFFRDSWNAVKRSDKAVSLIEDEVLDLAAREIDANAIGILTRRNIVTRGVPLIELLGREFTVGAVRMRGIRLFEPCGRLVAVTKLPGLFKALEHRSGLKAAVVSDGEIRVGDAILLGENS
ncbi:MAG TPA: MOSC domain-containing protein [Candidatus Limnocylindrales bacterium]|nr:MOSC domain-containing protein [Candidatus Limnocylindrales bacterium]